jgi:Protein of unknown function (DUF3489)
MSTTKYFRINDDNSIDVFGSLAELSGHEVEFHTLAGLMKVTADFPMKRLVEIWNGITGLVPVKRFMNREAGLKRIWQAVEGLEVPEPEPVTEKLNSYPEGTGFRADSKQAQVVALMKRPNGAGLDEIMKVTGWQRHTVRGFIAGACAKKGIKVESTKSLEGVRTYKVVG